MLAKRKILKQRLKKLGAETKRRHVEASKADRKRSKRNLAKGDHDSREKINRARVTGKDGQAGIKVTRKQPIRPQRGLRRRRGLF